MTNKANASERFKGEGANIVKLGPVMFSRVIYKSTQTISHTVNFARLDFKFWPINDQLIFIHDSLINHMAMRPFQQQRDYNEMLCVSFLQWCQVGYKLCEQALRQTNQQSGSFTSFASELPLYPFYICYSKSFRPQKSTLFYFLHGKCSPQFSATGTLPSECHSWKQP